MVTVMLPDVFAVIVAAAPSKVTPVAPPRFDPEIITLCPPAVGPLEGLRLVMTGVVVL
jgi:hypothetical protein